jgi:hypothetical protein
MTLPVPAYTAASVTTHTDPTDALTTLNALALAGSRQYGRQLFRVDDTGAVLEDLTPYVVSSSGTSRCIVSRDCNVECSGKLTLSIAKRLAWGSDRIKPWLLIRSPGYAAGKWQAFPRGIFVATSPGKPNLDHPGVFDVTGWDRCYLLQSDPNVTLSFAAGSTYGAAVKAVFVAAGILASAANLSTIVDYPGDWPGKTLATPSNYPVASGRNHLQIVNELLGASGMRPLFADPSSGRYTIAAQTVPTSEALRWRLQGGDVPNPPTALGDTGWPDRKIVIASDQAYTGDVYNAPNRWIFVQSGLSFQPTEGSGKYTVNNTSTPPTDQTTVGRIITKALALDASGQTDLKTQGDAVVTADLASFEKITLTTAPWPCRWPLRCVLAHPPRAPRFADPARAGAGWSMPLGEPGGMSWDTNVVGLQ